MKVKKINPQWVPTENKALRVGETIEITDPKALILKGDVVAVTEEGAEISAYELYGVIVRNERAEFEEWLKIKKQQALKAQLEKEAEELKAQADLPASVTDTTREAVSGVTPQTEEVTLTPEEVTRQKRIAALEKARAARAAK